MVRLQKFLADAGVASRRACERIILEGRVEVNRQVVRELGTKIDPEQDRVVCDRKVLKPKRRLYVALNKPPGYITSRKDPEGRQTVFELLPREWDNLYPVGRLDFYSEGLIFLTNDGDFCLRLTHPRYGIRKKYRVTLEGEATPDHLKAISRGVYDQGELLRVEKAQIIRANKSQSIVDLELSEGKNHEVRRLFQSQGLTVKRLQRTQIGPIKLAELRVGKWRTLTGAEIKSLMARL
jgi:23S rRNA pseudouridine2605 synthase